MKISKMKSEAS
jgi:hypothetical protein